MSLIKFAGLAVNETEGGVKGGGDPNFAYKQRYLIKECRKLRKSTLFRFVLPSIIWLIWNVTKNGPFSGQLGS